MSAGRAMSHAASSRGRTPAHAARRPADDERLHADEAMRLAIDAFDRGSALVDLTHRRMHWCSPGFSSHCLIYTDDALERLEPLIPGVTTTLMQLARSPQLKAPVLAAAPAAADRAPTEPALRVQAALVRPGLAALRLLPDGDDGAAAPHHTNAQEREQAARRHLEDREKLLFTSRVLSVGEMASTLAHELNQPIGTVANVLRGLRTRIARGDAAGDDAARDALQNGVQLALEQALFASRIIARIREYTQSREPRRERLEWGAVVRESLALLDWEVQRDGVDVSLAMTGSPSPVLGDEVMLQQLVVNLLRNAIEAMRDNPPDARGRVRRTLEITLTHERGGREAVLRIADDGCGLPSDAQAQLFVPFQSTKPNGMGIGLNICRSFAELHQGRLWFSPNGDEGAPARGCSFHVALPLETRSTAP